MRYLKINDLLMKENILIENFNRYDLLIKYYTIKQYLNCKSGAFNLYLKMQEARDKNRLNTNISIEIFKKYINFYLYYMGVNNRGIQVDIQPIPLANDIDRFIDGSHRLSCHIYFELENIPVIKIHNKWGEGIKYDREWFANNNFEESQLKMLDNIRLEIIKRRKLC